MGGSNRQCEVSNAYSDTREAKGKDTSQVETEGVSEVSR